MIRFLSHTGLRIAEARQMSWKDVREDFLVVPGSISKSGRPRVIPFVNGIAGVLEAVEEGRGRFGDQSFPRTNANALYGPPAGARACRGYRITVSVITSRRAASRAVWIFRR